MARKKTTEPEKIEYKAVRGRMLLRNGEQHILIAVPSAFFSSLGGATQEEADRLTDRIAYLLTEYGE